MSGERRFFRRDRLTGHIAIGVVGVLCAAAVVFGVGMASAKYHLSDVGGWLTSVHRGELVHVNGLSGKVDGKVTLSGSTGHPMKVIQQGGVVLIVDEVTGVVSRVDPAHLNVVQGATFRGAAGMQVVSGSGQAYALDQQKGSVQRLDPMTLATMGSPLGLTGPLGSAGIDATSVLWVPVPTNGQAAPVRSGQAAQPIGIGRAGDDLSLTIAAGAPVITDFTSAQAVIIGKNGTQIKVRLPSTVAQVGKGSVLAPASTDGQLVPLLAGNSLVVLNTGSGSISSVALKLPPKHKLAAPQALGQKVYIPDQSSGDLIVYDSATNRMAPQVPVTGQAGPLDAFVKDGLLWVNGPDSAKGVVVDGAGGHKPIQKYTPDVPGSQKSPVPRVGVPAGGASGRPKPGGGGPTAPSHPRLPTKPPVTPPTHKPDPPKVTPPNAPTNLRATPQPDGTIKVDFQPGGGGDATGYKLLTSDGLTATPDKIGANGPDYTFTVNGGTCGQEYQFAVAALYHNRDHDSEVDSEYTTPTLSCTEPDAPSNITGTGTAQGAKIDWQAPPNADNKKVTYAVNVTGPKTGSNPNLTGTSVTFGDIWKNGTYTVKVTASNPAGTKTASNSVDLAGPVNTYGIHHGGNPSDISYVTKTPDANNLNDSNVAEEIPNANTQTVQVRCQKMGTHYAHSNGDPDFAGSLYDYIEHNGHIGYMIGYLPNTPHTPWQELAGPAIWECAD
ncbi:fibronectin type III domain-containing protein [Actinoallomurus iriomotensis]|uniref:Fibronectin type-III domain-containing protein n=1 Tax=Actinoallomurus iriomotensis TaxID=478107 RepID=A0A9W6W4S0_9ACTN|nr:fibronectin type III domain-containing protein [Actinoallomurus iriomotensis]GLY90247.1 hypothetical protein Airi02_081760 [Actinoallomurus iriomotensis]